MFIDSNALPDILRLSDQTLQEIIDRKTNTMRRYFHQSGFLQAIIGLSGGIDSAVSLALAVQALGSDNVICVRLPYGPKPKASFFRAGEISERCGLSDDNLFSENITLPVSATCQRLGIDMNSTDESVRLRIGNIAARMRMIVLMDYATRHRALLVGTENLTEHHMAYFTIGGDSVSNYEPFMGDLWKVQVFQLGAALGLPDSVLDCPPSAELWDGQTDEDEMQVSYVIIDTVLCGTLQHNLTKSEIIRSFDVTPEQYDRVMRRYIAMHGKANAPFISP